jgi:hypothetical protein
VAVGSDNDILKEDTASTFRLEVGRMATQADYMHTGAVLHDLWERATASVESEATGSGYHQWIK